MCEGARLLLSFDPHMSFTVVRLFVRQWDYNGGSSWPSSMPRPTVDATFYIDTVLECHPTILSPADYALCQTWFAGTYSQLPQVRYQWRTSVVTLTAAGPGGCRRQSIKDGVQRYDETLLGDDLPLFYAQSNRGMVVTKDFILMNEGSEDTRWTNHAPRFVTMSSCAALLACVSWLSENTAESDNSGFPIQT